MSAADYPFVRLRVALFAAWFVVTAVPLGYLMAWHVVPLPSERAPQAGAGWREAASGMWQVIHVLSPDCRCSLGVAAHLEQRRAFQGAVERVWLVGSDPALSRRLAARGQEADACVKDVAQASHAEISTLTRIVDDLQRASDLFAGHSRHHVGTTTDSSRQLKDDAAELSATVQEILRLVGARETSPAPSSVPPTQDGLVRHLTAA